MKTSRTAFTLTELMTLILLSAMLLAIALPALGRGRSTSMAAVSLDNLHVQGAAYASYAADWNGRQYTNIVDDISSYGSNMIIAFNAYANANGQPHPPILLGYDENSALWGYFMNLIGNRELPQPIVFAGLQDGFGHHRLQNAAPFHAYVNGHFYDPVFYPPTDTIAYQEAEPLFSDPAQYVPHLPPFWSSYCTSAAAMFDPAVMRSEPEGGWQDPWSIDEGFTSPPLASARYPSLKTHVLEHHWNQRAPADPCNPAIEGSAYSCEPYYFNHARGSAPATLFYDGSTRIFADREARMADQRLLDQTGFGLWSRDTPLGTDGYFISLGFDGSPISHHVLTTDGINGRDTINAGFAPSATTVPW